MSIHTEIKITDEYRDVFNHLIREIIADIHAWFGTGDNKLMESEINFMNKILIGKTNGYVSMFPNGPIDERIYRIESFQHIVKEIEYMRRKVAVSIIGERKVQDREYYINDLYREKTLACLKTYDVIKIFDIVQKGQNDFEFL